MCTREFRDKRIQDSKTRGKCMTQLYRLLGIRTTVQREEHVQRTVIAAAISIRIGSHSAVVSHLHRLPASQLTMKADIVQ